MTLRLPSLAVVATALLVGAVSAGVAQAQQPGDLAAQGIKPSFDLWSVQLGAPVSQIPEADVVDISCGTNGGPPSIPLDKATDYAQCPPEKSGLHEVFFRYDDEQEYIAKALGIDDPTMSAGTSMYAHPVLVSVLVDDGGVVRGIRAVTDDTASAFQRRSLFDLGNNLRERFATWKLDCKDIPPQDGEEPLGQTFVHFVCTGDNAQLGERVRIESRLFRRKGEVPIDPRTQKVVGGAYTSSTRFELVQTPYSPAVPATP